MSFLKIINDQNSTTDTISLEYECVGGTENNGTTYDEICNLRMDPIDFYNYIDYNQQIHVDFNRASSSIASTSIGIYGGQLTNIGYNENAAIGFIINQGQLIEISSYLRKEDAFWLNPPSDKIDVTIWREPVNQYENNGNIVILKELTIVLG